MSQISAADVKALRDRTNVPMMECKAALTEAGGDMEKAVEILRKKNKDISDKKGDRETAEGRIAVYIDPAKKVGAIVEMRCESAPVAKSEHVRRAGQRPRQAGRPARTRPASRSCWPSRSSTTRSKTVSDRDRRRRRPDPREHEAGPLRAARAACSAATSITTASSACCCRSKATQADAAAAARRVHAHRRPQPGGGPPRGRAGRRRRQGEGDRQGADRRRPQEQEQAGQHPREDRRGQDQDLVRRERPASSSRSSRTTPRRSATSCSPPA